MQRKLALVGYGKMGRLLDQLSPEYNLETVLRLDEFNNAGGAAFTKENFAAVDVAIEFSTPHVAFENIQALVKLGVPVVVGTTGWLDRLPEVAALVQQHDGAVLWSPNYSIGVNLFTKILQEAARLFSQQTDYGCYAWEIHHDSKKDAPSGTMLKLVEQMQQAGYAQPIDIASSRAGRVPGTHEVGFDSAADTITLTHTARNREGFARGALQAANWLVGKKGLHEFADVLFGPKSA